MKTTAIEIKKKSTVLARQVKAGICFKSGDKILMRTKPVQFILNSNLITDVINRGDILVTDLESGNLFAFKGDTEVQVLASELLYSEG